MKIYIKKLDNENIVIKNSVKFANKKY